MKYLNIKLRRDMRNNWTQFFSVFLMSFLSILVFVGLQGAWGGLEKSVNSFFEETNLADSWIYTTGIPDETFNELSERTGINEITNKTRIEVENNRRYLSIDTYDENNITQPYVVKGEKFSEEFANAIWLNKEYAEKNDLKINESIEVVFAGQPSELIIKGIIQSAERIYYTGSQEFIAPDYQKYGYGIISELTLKETFNYRGQPNIVEMKTSKKDSRKEIEALLGNRLIGYYHQKSLSEVANASDRVVQIRNLSYLFSFIFILLAVLAMYTTIRRLIENQTKEIAILKALGFSNQQLSFHFASFGFLIGGLGVLAGSICSPLLSNFVLDTQKEMFSLPKWFISYNYMSVIVCVLVLVICTFSAFFASSEARGGLPAQFLRGAGTKKVKNLFIEKNQWLWSKLSYENRWALRDSGINKVRMLMGIIGVSGGMMLLVAGFGMPESINHLVDKTYNTDFTYDKRLNSSNVSLLSQEIQGQAVQVLPSRFTPDDGFNRVLVVMNEGNFIHMQTEDGKGIESDGLYVTSGFAKRAGYKKNDTITVSPGMDEKDYQLKIKGIILSETNQGAYITHKKWEEVGGEFHPNTMLVGKEISLTEANKNSHVDSIVLMKDQKENAYEFVNSLTSIFHMIIGFAILLVVVVLYNLGSLNFVERMRDYATLRVLGFHNNELRRITMIETIITTLIGWIMGIPLGIWFLNQYVNTFSTIYLDYTSYVTPFNLIISSIVVWGCSLTTTLFIGRRIKKINMVESLKSVD